jgi:cytoskeletal protein CcmA (bactofilin family)
MWAVFLVISTLALFALPLIPALAELIWPTDNEPLRVVQEYDRNIRHFAQGFRQYIDKNLAHLLSEPGREGTLADGTRFRTAGKDGAISANDPESIPFLIISSTPLQLPDGYFFQSEVYSRSGIVSGLHNTFRAMLSDEDIALQDYSTVLRWIHAGKQLKVGVGCTLFGRASADTGISLSDECVFERISAPIIEFGNYSKQDVDIARAQGPRSTLETLPRVREQYGRRWLLDGALDFPAQHFFDGDIVARKAVNVGAYGHIKGSVKSNADCHVGAHVCVEGSAVSAQSMYVGPGCLIAGPLIAEETISIAAGTIVGSPGRLTSITAPRIIIEPGAMVYGTIWAVEEGLVRVAGQSLKKARA